MNSNSVQTFIATSSQDINVAESGFSKQSLCQPLKGARSHFQKPSYQPLLPFRV